MTTRITVANLLGAGFSITGSMPRNALPAEKQTILSVFSKGIMSIHLTDSSATAYKLGTELGPVSTMEQVQALNSVINPVPLDAITAERMESLGWENNYFGRYFIGRVAIDETTNGPSKRVYLSRRNEHLLIGYVSTMSEVEALTAIAKRGITKE